MPSWGPSLSPDGRTIAFVIGADAPYALVVIQTDGTGERQITTRPFKAFDIAEWSPDAATLLFTARNADGNADVLEVGRDGNPERTILGTPDNDFAATWSPDGARIAYLRGDYGNGNVVSRGRVMVAGADGSKPVAISETGDGYYPQWSPDARHVLAVDGRLSGGQPIVAILDPVDGHPAATFSLPDVPGLGRADLPSWQRLAP